MASFEKLGLKKDIIQALSTLGFTQALEVQEAIIPLALKCKNIVFTSKTGSGKTLAYSIGFLSKINKKIGIQMIVLVPTRELCIQVGKEIESVCDPLNIKVGMLYGGRDISGDHRTTKKKIQILVGTPGRLIQHVNEKNIKVGEVKLLVYDESDQMFDDGFYDECAYLKTRVSKDAQIILSSATISDKVKRFIQEEIVEYELLRIGQQIPKNIVQEKIFCTIPKKNELLLKFFSQKKFKRAMVFCNTKIRTTSISEFLKSHNLKAEGLHGDLEQQERVNRLNLFKEGKLPILVTTDVAARGLHIKNVDIIVNYDVPTRSEFYIHRIGRTGRNERQGYALTIICPEDDDRFYNIEFEYELDVKEIEIKNK